MPITFYDPYHDLALGPSGSWADVDEDGRLELVTNGNAYAIAGNVLVPVEQPPYWRCKGMPDLNRDGFIDRISYATIPHSLSAYELSLNRGDCTFRQVFRELYQDDSYPSSTVADFEGEGDLDFLVAASMAFNDGTTTPSFRPLVGVGGGFLPMMGYYDAEGRSTVDLDDDGDLDVLHPTWQDSLGVSMLSGGRFTSRRVGIPGRMGHVQTGDLDGDHDPDVLVLGQRSPGSSNAVPFASILWNNRGALTTDSTHGLPALSPSGYGPSPVSFGDVDEDGDLDAATSAFPSGTVSVWRNVAAGSPAKPAAPTNLRAIIEGNRVWLSWEGHDTHATYALRVGTRPGYGDVIAFGAAPNRARHLPGPGNLATARSVVLPSMVGRRTYYWSVQQVSASFQGSAFAPEQSFEVISTAAESGERSAALSLRLIGNPVHTELHLSIAARAGSAVRVTLHDGLGRSIATMFEGAVTGELEIRHDVSRLAAGCSALQRTPRKARYASRNGARGGVKVSRFRTSNAAQFPTSYLPGYSASAYVTFPVGRAVSLQPELLLSSTGSVIAGGTGRQQSLAVVGPPHLRRSARAPQGGVEGAVDANRTGPRRRRPRLAPQGERGLRGRHGVGRPHGRSWDELFERLDYGLAVGIGGSVGAGRLRVFGEVRFMFGLPDVARRPDYTHVIRVTPYQAGEASQARSQVFSFTFGIGI
ncbi:MAG TPA: VCBS repeat-containing protein [Rhodothermales bacterium]|nr:VCBS repeat-containing protein [Rhodothermales bacterium]